MPESHDAEPLERAVAAIYDAVLDPALLTAAIDAIAKATGAVGGMLGIFDIVNGQGHAPSIAGLDPELLALFEQRYGLNLWTQAIQQHARVGRSLSSEPFVDARALRATEFHDAILAPQGLVAQSFNLLRRDGRFTVGLAMMHGVPGRSAEPDVLHRMDLMGAHLGRAFELMRRLDTLQARLDTCEAALEQQRCAVFVLDGAAAIRYANAQAQRLLAEGDGLFSVGHWLSARHNGDGAMLAAAIANAAGRSDAAVTSGASLAVRRGPAHLPLLATVLPGSNSRRLSDLPGQPGEVLLFVADPGAQCDVAAALLREAFALTEREAAVALAAVRLGGLPAAAAEMGIAPSTARSHLQHVFDKTGTRHQVALAQLLDACGVLPDTGVNPSN